MAQRDFQTHQYASVPRNAADADKPPSYFNIIGQLRQVASGGENSLVKVGHNVYNILCSSIFFGVFLILLSILPIANLVIGILFRKQCTIQPNLPIWLIVIGFCGIALALARFVSILVFAIQARRGKDSHKLNTSFTCVISLISIFVFIWFLVGNYWVYPIFSKVQYDKELHPDEYCHKLCYLLAFWSITVTWIVLAAFVLLFIIAFGIIIASKKGLLCFKK